MLKHWNDTSATLTIKNNLSFSKYIVFNCLVLLGGGWDMPRSIKILDGEIWTHRRPDWLYQLPEAHEFTIFQHSSVRTSNMSMLFPTRPEHIFTLYFKTSQSYLFKSNRVDKMRQFLSFWKRAMVIPFWWWWPTIITFHPRTYLFLLPRTFHLFFMNVPLSLPRTFFFLSKERIVEQH